MNHASENQNQLLRNVSQTYGLSDVNSLIYNSNTTNNYDEYAHQRRMNAAPIGYYKVGLEFIVRKQKTDIVLSQMKMTVKTCFSNVDCFVAFFLNYIFVISE